MTKPDNGEWSTDTTWHRRQMKMLEVCEYMADELPANFRRMTLSKIRGYKNALDSLAGPPRAGTCHRTYATLISQLSSELKQLTGKDK